MTLSLYNSPEAVQKYVSNRNQKAPGCTQGWNVVGNLLDGHPSNVDLIPGQPTSPFDRPIPVTLDPNVMANLSSTFNLLQVCDGLGPLSFLPLVLAVLSLLFNMALHYRVLSLVG